jgi:tRNA modification GTPase
VALSDTIAAISTPPGAGGVAIVRVSGSEAHSIAKRLSGREPRANEAMLVDLKVDRALMLYFASPRSYTGEDTVEFHCHGGVVTPRRVLELAIAAGARMASRGEFTERAFLNGKLDYEAAEGVLSLINAKTDRAADAALSAMSMKGGREKRKLYEMALRLSAEIEHSLDVDESELPDGFFGSLKAQAFGILQAIGGELKRLKEGRILRDGALVVLAGEPNAGKSSLMNALLGEERAIVSDIPGTTRDSIEEWLDIEGFPVRLVDTAGLRETSERIEAEGVRRAKALIGDAALVLRLAVGGGAARGDNEISVASKCDLARGDGINVSAVTGEGISELKRAIAGRLERLAENCAEDSGGGVESALIQARSLAEECVNQAENAEAVLLGNAARALATKLGESVGAVYSEDLLESLFSRFCVGK